uniref:hypothetical protein n=1 Tax=Rubripirellula obstinata TaxID=406547 RepID=UPI001EE4BCDB
KRNKFLIAKYYVNTKDVAAQASPRASTRNETRGAMPNAAKRTNTFFPGPNLFTALGIAQRFVRQSELIQHGPMRLPELR